MRTRIQSHTHTHTHIHADTYIYIYKFSYLIYNSVGVKKKRLSDFQILQTDIREKNSVKRENAKNTRAT